MNEGKRKVGKKLTVKEKDGSYSLHPDTNFIRYVAQSKEAAANFAGALILEKKLAELNWRGDVAIPPGTPPHNILESFKRYTDLPLDLSWHSFLFYLSSYLLSKKVIVRVKNQTVKPAIKTVLLAPSASGKSYSLNRVEVGAPVLPTIEGIESGAKLIDTMYENEINGRPNAMLVDEFGQMLKKLEANGSPLADAKEYLLKAHDGKRISRKTLKNEIIVEDSTMSFLGLNVDETFIKILSPESLLDGFAQRFTYVLCERDPERSFRQFPRYENEEIENVVRQAWNEISLIKLHTEYSYTPDAIAAYDKHFFEIGGVVEEGNSIPISFYRRLMQNGHSLALCYHIILGKADSNIDVADVEWAMRQTRLHIADAAKLIASKSPKSNSAMFSVRDLDEKLAAAGKKLTARTIQRSVQGFRESSEKAAELLVAYQNTFGALNRERQKKL
jgi:hypothetical protein